MRLYLLHICVFIFLHASAQFDIPEPLPNTGVYAITDTVYMDVAGNDTNAGTFNAPVKSFTTALSKLPYGTAGINGGNAYGLILLKPGTYYTATGFQQYANTWQSGNTYRNVSVEGIGDVTVCGTVDTFASNTLLYLSGSHIYIRNLKLRYSNSHGILLSRSNITLPRQTNILIDGVQVDSVKGFCMLFKSIDSILVKNSSGLYGARPGSDSLTSPCQWPSGIKFLGCAYTTIHHSEIGYTRGEGLNFHNSHYGLAYNNLLHDNSSNIYDDNSANLIIRNNLIYNTPGINKRYWRTCPADTGANWSGTGILLANEGACINGNGPGHNFCRLDCSFPSESFWDVDSVYVFNNLFQNTSSVFSFWEGNTNVTGTNCIRNVFFFNNTVSGITGDSLANLIGVVNFYFPSYNPIFNSFYSYLSNVKIMNNIFSYDTSAFARLIPVRKVFSALHPGPMDITFSNNLWIQSHSSLGVGDVVRYELPFSSSLFKDSIYSVTPCETNSSYIYDAPVPFTILTEDFNYSPRRSPLSNVGAIELDSFCLIETKVFEPSFSKDIKVYPNPFHKNLELTVSNWGNKSAKSFNLEIEDLMGRIVWQGKLTNSNTTVDLAGFNKGVYLLKIQDEQFFSVKKIVKQ